MFQFPKATKIVKIIIGINLILWILEMILLRVDSLKSIVEMMFLTPDQFLSGEFWQIVTYGFFHSPTNIFHFILNMLIFYFFSSELNIKWGDKRFIFFYLISIFIGGVFVILESFIITSHYYIPTIGASAAVFALTTAYALTYAEREIYFFFFPIKAKYLIHIDLALIVLNYLSIGEKNSSNAAHLGGMIAAFLIIKIPWYRYKRKYKNKKEIKKYLKVVK